MCVCVRVKEGLAKRGWSRVLIKQAMIWYGYTVCCMGVTESTKERIRRARDTGSRLLFFFHTLRVCAFWDFAASNFP